MLGRPVDARHCSIEMITGRKRELFGQSVTPVISVFVFFLRLLFDKEVFGQLKFLSNSAFNQAGSFGEEILEVFFLHNIFGGLLGDKLWLLLICFVFGATLRAQLALICVRVLPSGLYDSGVVNSSASVFTTGHLSMHARLKVVVLIGVTFVLLNAQDSLGFLGINDVALNVPFVTLCLNFRHDLDLDHHRSYFVGPLVLDFSRHLLGLL